MKTNRSFTILFIAIFTFSCNKSNNNGKYAYNGIDSQILNIVDSIPVCFKEHPFVSICFSICYDGNMVIKFYNGLLIPAPSLPPLPIREVLISEEDGFVGYKKYGDKYLVFSNYNQNIIFDRYINRDSLNFDEKPFSFFKVYGYKLDRQFRDCNMIKKIYLINERDSLVFFEGKCDFNMD
jgi:hypothetical protein